jgi:hypothetical protein
VEIRDEGRPDPVVCRKEDVAVKKLIALALVLSFLVGSIVGCEKQAPMPATRPVGTGAAGTQP